MKPESKSEKRSEDKSEIMRSQTMPSEQFVAKAVLKPRNILPEKHIVCHDIIKEISDEDTNSENLNR